MSIAGAISVSGNDERYAQAGSACSRLEIKPLNAQIECHGLELL